MSDMVNVLKDGWIREGDPNEFFIIGDELDAGMSGVVYSGMIKEGVYEDKAHMLTTAASGSENGNKSLQKRKVAIKVIGIDSNNINNNDDEATMLQEVKKEVLYLQEMKGSRFIVELMGVWKKEGCLWIVMELCEIGSLSDVLIICSITFNEEQIREVCACVLMGLCALHPAHDSAGDNTNDSINNNSNSISTTNANVNSIASSSANDSIYKDKRAKSFIHRDIKSKNILLNLRGEVKIADLGIAAEITNENRRRNTLIGSPHWMSPEVIACNANTRTDDNIGYDDKADIWSLGITILELANGEPPHADMLPLEVLGVITNGKSPSLLQSKRRFSKDAIDFTDKCLLRNPDERPSASELLKHPFVAGKIAELIKRVETKSDDVGLPAMKRLAQQCFPKIIKWREVEMGHKMQMNLYDDDQTRASNSAKPNGTPSGKGQGSALPPAPPLVNVTILPSTAHATTTTSNKNGATQVGADSDASLNHPITRDRVPSAYKEEASAKSVFDGKGSPNPQQRKRVVSASLKAFQGKLSSLRAQFEKNS